MFPRSRHFRPVAFLVLLVVLAVSGPVDAGWMGFRNDTATTLVVQESVSAGRTAKPQKIFANETVRDTPPAGAQRTFTIVDPAKPDRPLYTGRFAAPADNENVLYVIKSDGKGGLTIDAIKSPVGVSKHSPKR
jgi:hypothetical protein